MQKTEIRPIAVYLIEHHPLQLSQPESGFDWFHADQDLEAELESLIGPHDPEMVTVLTDEEPAGPQWQRLLEAVMDEEIRMVITHLAPLTTAQRQQLIAICAQSGTQLITPSDAGRNRPGDDLFS
jgi:hypothetical protein